MAKNYRSALIGLFGDPVDANPTGVMEEAAFREKGLNYRYITMRVKKDDLSAAFLGIKAAGFAGLNFTMPFKQAILPLLDELSPAAKIIGAVNTTVCKGGKWFGDNTDGKGFVSALKKAGATLNGKHITMLGAGGAARAIGVECALSGAAQIHIVNRTEKNGRELAGLIAKETSASADYLPLTPKFKIPADTDILIQATCIGLYPNDNEKPDIDYDTISPDMVVGDVVFSPAMPLFLQEAEKRGAKIVTGISMLVEQGALAFTLWTGQDAPVTTMYRVLEEELRVSE